MEINGKEKNIGKQFSFEFTEVSRLKKKDLVKWGYFKTE